MTEFWPDPISAMRAYFERESKRGLGPPPRLPFEPLPSWMADLPDDVRERVERAFGVKLPRRLDDDTIAP